MKYLCFVVAILLLVAGVSAVVPTAQFTSDETYGLSPFTISFSDTTSGGSTGQSWFFGDEKYDGGWEEINQTYPWYLLTQWLGDLLKLSDDSIIHIGDGNFNSNITYISYNDGKSWEILSNNNGIITPTPHRTINNYGLTKPSLVSFPDNTLVLTGGEYYISDDTYQPASSNQTWRSTDNGTTWQLVNASSGWLERSRHDMVITSDGSLVLIGGYKVTGWNGESPSYSYFNDVWRSTDKGSTWMRMNASAGWSSRSDPSCVALSDGSIVLMGGGGKNDVWRSTDNGAKWTRINASVSGWTGRWNTASVALSDDSILLVGGYNNTVLFFDVWKSMDKGYTWVKICDNIPINEYNIIAGSMIKLSNNNLIIRTEASTYISTNGGITWGMDGFLIRSTYNPSILLNDGSIILISGKYVFKSTNRDMNWSIISDTFQGALYSKIVQLLDNSLIITSGYIDADYVNSTYRSIDGGVTWIEQSATAEWMGRDEFGFVKLSDDSIVLIGGEGSEQYFNDVWRSTDKGVTWTQQTSNAGWDERGYFQAVVLSDDSIVISGGVNYDWDMYYNDVWRSTDKGVTWVQQNASAGWTPRNDHTMVVMPDDSLIVMGGEDDVNETTYSTHDVWRSTDKGVTWTQLQDADWVDRAAHTSLVMPDGSILVMGGWGKSNYNNDVWLLSPYTSTAKNPTHTYTGTTGQTFNVTLRSYNSDGYDTELKSNYITVGRDPEHILAAENTEKRQGIDIMAFIYISVLLLMAISVIALIARVMNVDS